MRILAGVTMLLLAAFRASAQPSLPAGEAQDYSLEANSFVEALFKLSVKFQFPLGVESVESTPTRKFVQFAWPRITAHDAISAVVSTLSNYSWSVDDGVVHVFRKDLPSDKRNFLNIAGVPPSEGRQSVGMENAQLNCLANNRVHHPEQEGCAISVIGSPSQPVCNFGGKDSTVRNVLNQMVKCGFPSPTQPAVWIVTFPEGRRLTPTGFLEIHPFWLLTDWRNPPPPPR